jgi:putative transposase
VAASDHPDLRRAPAAQQLPLRLEKGLAGAGQGPQADLHRTQRIGRHELFLTFTEAWGQRYPAIIKLWESAWPEFVPFLQFDTSIRSVVCTTNAIESINARIRRAVNARGHFPTEAAALKCVYMAIMSLDPTGRGRKRWTNRWKEALNAFDITFDGRLSTARK